ncbi:hypothetical protein BKN38_09370 [Helicobacter sp. CLO-3]|uniref:carbonic anhydrase n=1 Tax=unclassified Helicobacter TaxID=2593540 RepID=UPI000805AA7D|nr:MULTISPECIES: carbonic anhydrase family protein [unclassified Helicobacter]OBV28628.1 hypothetical protein BA723_01810 [Helicobacter sp. CLO-3]OHU81297.1 hypothetical protein BKN38_09370 [Helicobacter sp. CLO-3]
MRILSLVLFGFLASAGADGAHHWGYKGEGAPQNWGDISTDFHACKYGKYQSPIDITSTIKATTDNPLAFAYKGEAKDVANNGHSLQVNFKEGSTLKLDGKDFNLVQMHFHTPSEYTFNGKHFPMVAHIVHQTKEGQILVLALMFEEGKENEVIKQIWSSAPKKAGESKALAALDMNALVGKVESYIRLDGSLTTPPCTEGVIWIISQNNAKASKAQIKTFTNIIGVNNRPVQPANGRVVIEAK